MLMEVSYLSMRWLSVGFTWRSISGVLMKMWA